MSGLGPGNRDAPAGASKGANMTVDADRRRVNYLRQTGRPELTPRQRRRLEKKQSARERPPQGRR